jgi:hypothetical protein
MTAAEKEVRRAQARARHQRRRAAEAQAVAQKCEDLGYGLKAAFLRRVARAHLNLADRLERAAMTAASTALAAVEGAR